jgi:structural maintenance of chromosome 4
LDKLHGKTAAIDTQIKALHEKILEVGGVKLRALQSKVVNTRTLIDLAGDNLTKAEVAKAKAERDTEKYDKALATDATKVEEIDGELETVESDLKACVADFQTIQSRVDEAKIGMESVQDVLGEAKKELEEKATSINSFRAFEVEVNQKIEEQERLLRDHNAKLRHWEKRNQDLELVHVE